MSKLVVRVYKSIDGYEAALDRVTEQGDTEERTLLGSRATKAEAMTLAKKYAKVEGVDVHDLTA